MGKNKEQFMRIREMEKDSDNDIEAMISSHFLQCVI